MWKPKSSSGLASGINQVNNDVRQKKYDDFGGAGQSKSEAKTLEFNSFGVPEVVKKAEYIGGQKPQTISSLIDFGSGAPPK